MKLYLFTAILLTTVLSTSCTEPKHKHAEIEPGKHFVAFSSNIPLNNKILEGKEKKIDLFPSMSFESDILCYISLSGTAKLGEDFEINILEKFKYATIESIDATQLVIKGSPIQEGTTADIFSLNVKFLEDGIVDGEKTLTLQIEKGVVVDTSEEIIGGRGSINSTTFVIEDID